ncbi:toll/interleukin-1 receptor domain-containing protein [Brevundimonas sp.]|uniref:toll/interleukin-1 receptor domain-containing protein n=1 Tax=Brevundimonas sp. TaxID=1871086 RepID=UPI0025CBE8A5|nr:toll/interleukin-1 receptor domain-containing protein [Brevundimonas sp.]
MADVFVSYDRRDRELAQKVVQALTEQGMTVWWDDRITPNETWDKTIERELDSARKVLVLWTDYSVQSDWVRTEAGAAREAASPKLIQARFSDCKVPLAFRLIQAVDLMGWTPRRKHAGWDRLVQWLKDGQEEKAAEAPAAPAAPAAVSSEPAAASQPVTPDPISAAEPAEPVPAETPAQGGLGLGSFPKVDLPKVEIPNVEMPNLDEVKARVGGIDRKWLLIGGGAVAAVLLIAVLAITLGGGGGGGGGFSAEERTTLGGYLDSYATQYAPGLEAVMDDELARIAPGAAYDFEVELGQGDTVRVLGACDTNCSDVDLYVTGPDGVEIGSDTLLDDYPVVEIPNTVGGVYTIRIAMPTCSAETCIGAARLYAVQ